MNTFVRRILAIAPAVLLFGLLCATAHAGTDINDLDGDGVLNGDDNCPFTPNPAQADSDGDGIGNECDVRNDLDLDQDGVLNHQDNCPFYYNPSQQDSDEDGHGDPCDPHLVNDPDGDSIFNPSDNCPFIANQDQSDADSDGVGNVCDTFNNLDLDEDFVLNAQDNCPFVVNGGQEDSDGDGIGDECDHQVNAADPRPATETVSFAAPNPSANHFTIRFGLAEDAQGSLAVFDVSGRLVRTLESGTLRAGDHAVTWDGRSESGVAMPSGIYYVRLRGGKLSFEHTLVKLDR